MPVIGKLTSAKDTNTLRFLSNSLNPVLNCLKRKNTKAKQKITPYWHKTSRKTLCVTVVPPFANCSIAANMPPIPQPKPEYSTNTFKALPQISKRESSAVAPPSDNRKVRINNIDSPYL